MLKAIKNFLTPPPVKSRAEIFDYLVWLGIRSGQVTYPFNILNILKAYSDQNISALISYIAYSVASAYSIWLLYKYRVKYYTLATYLTVLGGLISMALTVASEPLQAYSLVIWIPAISLVIHYYTYKINNRAFYLMTIVMVVVTVYVISKMPFHLSIADNVGFQFQFGFSMLTCLGWMSMYLSSRIIVQESLLKSLEQEKELAITLNRIVSHDLANSLSITLASLEFIKLKPEAFEKYLPRVEKSAHQMEEIVKSTRQLSLINTGKSNMTATRCDVQSIIREVLEQFQDRIQKKNITVNYSEMSSVDVYFDPVALRHNIIANLITNAIKFTPRGGRIEIQLKDIGDEIQLSIQDSGIGIPEEMKEDLFDMSKKTSRPGTDGESGTGFGLPIVKKILERFNATIQVESKEGNGTKFILNLPKILSQREKQPA